MRVVFDTNIYVSALAVPGGVAERALRLAMSGHFELALSQSILDEILGILARKFAREAEELSRTAIFLASVADFVVTTRHVRILGDLPDNRILECALAAGAEVIVTGDHAMLGLGTWQGIQILSLRQFVDRFETQAHEARAQYRARRSATTTRVGTEPQGAPSPYEVAFLVKYLRTPGARAVHRGKRTGTRG